MQKKYKIKKGDNVIVIAGNSKDQKGKVLEVNSKTDRVIVEGVNMISKHTKPNAKHPQGGIIKQEAPIHISNIRLVDPKTGEATGIRIERDENNKPVRYSKKSGEEIK